MTDEEPIKLELEDDELRVKKPDIEMNECFGMVRCPHCHIHPEKFTLEDGTELVSERPFCDNVKKYVVDIFAKSMRSQCPLGYWFRKHMHNYRMSKVSKAKSVKWRERWKGKTK
jgi:hypothetical protein